MKLRTSVVIPSYNEKEFLPRCLAALHKQELPVFEIIVVDNNSNDGSIEAAKKKFPSVRFLEEKEQGIVYARNTGFDAARGDRIAKLDADSIVEPDWHTNLAQTMGSQDGWSGYIHMQEIHPKVSPVADFLFNVFTFRINSQVARCTLMFGSNLAIRKDAWQLIRNDVLMRNDIWEDLDLSLAMQDASLSATQSSYKGVTISARSANSNIGVFYKRVMGAPRVFFLRKRWLSLVLAIIDVHVGFLIWLVLKPVAFIGQTVGVRPRQEQY